jgi:hypothetical protein
MCGRVAWQTVEALPQAAMEAPLKARLVEPSQPRTGIFRGLEAGIGLVLIAVVVLAVFLGLYPYAKGAAIVMVVIAGFAILIAITRGGKSELQSRPTVRPAAAMHAQDPQSPPAQTDVQRPNTTSIVLAVLGSVLGVFGILAIVALCLVVSTIVAIGRICGMFLGIK